MDGKYYGMRPPFIGRTIDEQSGSDSENNQM